MYVLKRSLKLTILENESISLWNLSATAPARAEVNSEQSGTRTRQKPGDAVGVMTHGPTVN